MRVAVRITIAALALSIVHGCTAEKAPTPQVVSERFHALLDSIAGAAPGAAAARLRAFQIANDAYAIADSAQAELDRLGASVSGQYHTARELARQGEFELADRILHDLAEYFPDTPDGRKASAYLEFDYHFGKAQWLMVRRRVDECEAVARALLERDLTAYQANQVEQMLDNVGLVNTAVGQAERHSTMAACRHLRVLLETRYVEEGRYPQTLSLEEMESWSGSRLDGLSAIEDYRVSREGVSFVGVSENGRHRVRVVNGRIVD